MSQLPDLDLNAFSLDELKQLQKDIAKAIKDFDDRRKAEARAALEAKAGELGFSLNDLVAPGSSKKQKLPAKYRNPEDPTQTWSGRGRRPQWVTDALDAGKGLEDLAI
ncbi:DNA-binding protein H-NS [Pseudooceanicola antarcticus]|uniref:DNA-binding protein H-NS n=1 Tax=Pseudooceanicola antarcticus TaxID=1247613 RepID=A0A285JKM3_9RHOB|nr:H-NS histone family protein [Pseudooceanicola antarcticus]PJE26512.1 transcriptional regulator [Pseudooceanicola antarcticus]SNY60862.1 DNA-binding protein H-NS [Pseudooceanicola antarcticus]